jgi:hypothetical protein
MDDRIVEPGFGKDSQDRGDTHDRIMAPQGVDDVNGEIETGGRERDHMAPVARRGIAQTRRFWKR